MNVNFYNTDCQTSDIKDISFGICDDQIGAKAYVSTKSQDKWIATVENNAEIPLVFTAIDNCIEIRRANGEMDSRCDGMLTYPDNIVFIELKNEIKNWISDGLQQLETTIVNFKTHHDLASIKHKRAFLSNRRKAHFHVLSQELKRRFYDKYKVRINVEGKIVVK